MNKRVTTQRFIKLHFPEMKKIKLDLITMTCESDVEFIMKMILCIDKKYNGIPRICQRLDSYDSGDGKRRLVPHRGVTLPHTRYVSSSLILLRP